MQLPFVASYKGLSFVHHLLFISVVTEKYNRGLYVSFEILHVNKWAFWSMMFNCGEIYW